MLSQGGTKVAIFLARSMIRKGFPFAEQPHQLVHGSYNNASNALTIKLHPFVKTYFCAYVFINFRTVNKNYSLKLFVKIEVSLQFSQRQCSYFK